MLLFLRRHWLRVAIVACALAAVPLGLRLVVPARACTSGSTGACTSPTAGSPSSPSVQDNVVWRVPTTAPDVAVTFDDGPDPTFSPQFLAVLKAHGAHGTFFVLGSQAERFPAILRAEAAEGSEVCNHGWEHLMLRGRSATVVEQNVVRTQQLLRQLQLPECGLFRFPYFASDQLARAVVARLGLRMVGANVDTLDWRLPNPNNVAQQVLGRVQAGDIILLHDGGGPRARSVEALRLILDGLPQKRLRAVTVGQLLASVDHGRPPAHDEE